MLLRKKEKIKIFLLSIVSAGILFSCGNDDDSGTVIPTSTFLGEVDYVKTYGGSGIDGAVSIVQANDGNYIVLGNTNSTDGDLIGRLDQGIDYWLLKLDVNGEKIWSKTYGGTGNDTATNITKTSDGGYVISGYSRSTDGDITTNAGFHDFWLLKINNSGDIQWEKSHGFLGSDQAFNIFETAEGNFLATGFFDVSACKDSNGDPILCPGNDLQNNNDSKKPQHGVGEYWAILMDSNGTKIWRKYFGGNLNDRSYDAVQTNDGGFLLAGQSESENGIFDIHDDKGSYDFWLVRLDSNGTKLWTKSFGGAEIDQGYAITKTPDGNYIMVGDSRSEDQDVTSPHGGGDAWAIKFDDNGNKIWEKSYGGTAFDSARSIKPMTNGGYLISGFTRSTDGDIATNNGQNEIWVFMIDENGTLTFETTIGGSALDFGFDAIQTNNNEIIIVGNTESNDFDIISNQGIKDLILIKIK